MWPVCLRKDCSRYSNATTFVNWFRQADLRCCSTETKNRRTEVPFPILRVRTLTSCCRRLPQTRSTSLLQILRCTLRFRTFDGAVQEIRKSHLVRDFGRMGD